MVLAAIGCAVFPAQYYLGLVFYPNPSYEIFFVRMIGCWFCGIGITILTCFALCIVYYIVIKATADFLFKE